jgi:hypothetical protein
MSPASHAQSNKADIACRRLAELSRSVTRRHRRFWLARCPAGQTCQLSPGLRDVSSATTPSLAPGRPTLLVVLVCPGDTFLTRKSWQVMSHVFLPLGPGPAAPHVPPSRRGAVPEGNCAAGLILLSPGTRNTAASIRVGTSDRAGSRPEPGIGLNGWREGYCHSVSQPCGWAGGPGVARAARAGQAPCPGNRSRAVKRTRWWRPDSTQAWSQTCVPVCGPATRTRSRRCSPLMRRRCTGTPPG